MIGFLVLVEIIDQDLPFNASATTALIGTPDTEGPLSPVNSMRGPRDVQLSSQNLAVIPDPTLQTTNCLARGRNLHSLRQIQLP